MRGEESDIDVGMRRHFAASVAADRDHCQPLARGAIAGAVDVGDDVIVDDADQLVDKECLRFGAAIAGGGFFQQAAGDFCAPFGQRGAEQVDNLPADADSSFSRDLFGRFDRDDICYCIGQGAAVDDCALVRQGLLPGGRIGFGNSRGLHGPSLAALHPCA